MLGLAAPNLPTALEELKRLALARAQLNEEEVSHARGYVDNPDVALIRNQTSVIGCMDVQQLRHLLAELVAAALLC